MIVDSSALLAILKHEPDAALFARALAEHPAPLIAAPTVLEASLVAGPQTPELDELLQAAGVTVVPFGSEHLELARQAHDRYGRGSGSSARLNFGDCISYAVAKSVGGPLLFKGKDFTHTDIPAALSRYTT